MEASERDSIIRDVRKVHKRWPSFLSDSTPQAEKAAMALDVASRREALKLADDFVKLCKHRREKVCTFAVYLKERRWEKLADLSDEERRLMNTPPEVVRARPKIYGVYGPEWAAARMLALLDGPVDFLPDNLRDLVAITHDWHLKRGTAAAYRGKLGIDVGEAGALVFPEDFERQEWRRRLVDEGFPEVNRLHDAAKDRSHVTIDAAFERAKDLCEFVPIGSGVWLAWEREHEARSWPMLPAPGVMKGAYFPKGGPEGLEEFERAARSIMAARGEDDAA